MKTRTKHILIEILPRALWTIEGITLILVYSLIENRGPITTDNNFLLAIGVPLTIWGIWYLVNTFYKLAKPMFTKELVTDGPYKHVRHPMYVSMYILLSGLGILFFSVLWFVVLIAFIPMWYLDCFLEETQMTDLWGEQYIDYKNKVGMFFPKLKK